MQLSKNLFFGNKKEKKKWNKSEVETFIVI